MTDTTGIISVTNTAAIAAPAPRAPQSAQTDTGFSVSNATAAPAVTTTKSGDTASTLAGRASIDPVAGIITEYIGRDGSVVNQVPSSTALAYLRLGLTATGERRPDIATA